MHFAVAAAANQQRAEQMLLLLLMSWDEMRRKEKRKKKWVYEIAYYSYCVKYFVTLNYLSIITPNQNGITCTLIKKKMWMWMQS
jgi:hypothetical protein